MAFDIWHHSDRSYIFDVISKTKNKTMKNILIFIMCLFFFYNVSYAQNIMHRDIYRNAISTDIMPVFWGNYFLTSDYNLSYERMLNPRFSIAVGGSLIRTNFFLKRSNPNFENNVDIKGYGFIIYPKYHPKSNGNFEFGSELYYKTVLYSNKNNNEEIPRLKKWRLTLKSTYNININNFRISPFLGIGVKFRNYLYEKAKVYPFEDTQENFKRSWSLEINDNFKIAIPFGFTLGIRF